MMAYHKGMYNTGVMGMNFGRYEDQKKKLAAERRQEYNRLMAQKQEREKTYTVVTTQHVNKKDPMPLPKRPPSSISAFARPKALLSKNNTFGAPSGILSSTFPSNNFSSTTASNGFGSTLSNDFGFEKQNLEGALSQLQNFWGPSSSTNTSDFSLPSPPRFSSSADAALTSFEPPPLQSTFATERPSFSAPDRVKTVPGFVGFDSSSDTQLNNSSNTRKSSGSIGSTYTPSIYDDSSKKRGQYEDNSKVEEYNPWGKGGAGAPIRDAGGNVISSRAYRHAGHQQAPAGSNLDSYHSDLRQQILDNKQRQSNMEMQRRMEDEKIERRAAEQSERMKNEYEAEQAKHKRKEEELMKKQEMIRNIQEQQMIEDKRRRQEIEEKRRIGRERLEEDNNNFRFDDQNRVKSPVIPTLLSKKNGGNFEAPSQFNIQNRETEPEDVIRVEEPSKSEETPQKQALDTLSSVRQHLQARQMELQNEIDQQRNKYKANRQSISSFPDEELFAPRESFLRSASRIKSSVGGGFKNAKSSDFISKNRARMRRLSQFERDVDAIHNS